MVINVGSPVMANVPFWEGMPVMGEAVRVDAECVGNFCTFLSFCCEPKAAQK